MSEGRSGTGSTSAPTVLRMILGRRLQERRVAADEAVLGEGDAGPAIQAVSDALDSMHDGLLALAKE